MPSLSTYSAERIMPTHRGCSRRWNACCTARKAAAVLLHSRSAGTEGAQRLQWGSGKHHIRVEEADKALPHFGKDNRFAAAVFSKFEDDLRP